MHTCIRPDVWCFCPFLSTSGSKLRTDLQLFRTNICLLQTDVLNTVQHRSSEDYRRNLPSNPGFLCSRRLFLMQSSGQNYDCSGQIYDFSLSVVVVFFEVQDKYKNSLHLPSQNLSVCSSTKQRTEIRNSSVHRYSYICPLLFCGLSFSYRSFVCAYLCLLLCGLSVPCRTSVRFFCLFHLEIENVLSAPFRTFVRFARLQMQSL